MRRILLSAFIFALMLSSKLLAYTYTDDFKMGFYWKTFPVKMTVFAATASEGAMLFSLAKLAEEQWEDETGMDLFDFGTSYVIGTPNTPNSLYWADNFAAASGHDPATTLAVTVRKSVGTYLTSAQIIFNGTLSFLRQNFADSLKKTVIHEMGHVIGLGHSEYHAIMAPMISELTYLQPDDIQGANDVIDEAIYRQKTGYISPNAYTEEKVMTCGSVEAKNNSGSGFYPFLLSLLVGVLLVQSRVGFTLVKASSSFFTRKS